MGSIGIWQLLIILVIVLLLFGTKRLKSLGGDLGGAIKGFKKALNDEEGKNAGDDEKDEAADDTVKQVHSENVNSAEHSDSEEHNKTQTK